MPQIVLTFSSSEGTREIPIEEGKISFGRSGNDADYRIDDGGLSRLHATVYRDGDKLWIVDENSTNGSFVNGERVGARGTILRHGDEIKIGNETYLTVHVLTEQAAAQKSGSGGGARTVSGDGETHGNFPMAIVLGITAFAILVIGASAVLIGVRVLGNDNEPVIVENTPYEDPTPDDANENKNTKKTPKPTASTESTPLDNGNVGTNTNQLIPTTQTPTVIVLPKGRYQDMSEADKDRYITVKAEKIAREISSQKADPIPPDAVKVIKEYVNGYASRLSKAKKDSCEQGKWIGSDFTSVLNRATKTSPMIVRHFLSEGIPPAIGIYVAMIEGEHCPCLTSNTGAKGMFQFLASSAPDYGLDPNRRCEPDESAKAGAKYLKSLIARYGTAPDSVPLAIASFNSGQGNLSQNLDKVLSDAAGQNRSFWTLAANKNVLQGRAGEQFKGENIRYVPKFFATAIIGENPQDFGVPLQPLSTYSK